MPWFWLEKCVQTDRSVFHTSARPGFRPSRPEICPSRSGRRQTDSGYAAFMCRARRDSHPDRRAFARPTSVARIGARSRARPLPGLRWPVRPPTGFPLTPLTAPVPTARASRGRRRGCRRAPAVIPVNRRRTAAMDGEEARRRRRRRMLNYRRLNPTACPAGSLYGGPPGSDVTTRQGACRQCFERHPGPYGGGSRNVGR